MPFFNLLLGPDRYQFSLHCSTNSSVVFKDPELLIYGMPLSYVQIAATGSESGETNIFTPNMLVIAHASIPAFVHP